MQTEINPLLLRFERDSHKLTQQELADRAGLSLRQIVALEKKKTDGSGHPVRESTVTKLANALRVSSGALVMHEPGEWIAAGPGQALHLPIRASSQLRFDVIKERYGVSLTDLVEAAPMLFMLAARASLAWRREKLSEAASHLDELRTSMGFVLTEEQREMLASIDAGLAAEADAIEHEKLFTLSERSGEHAFESNRFLDWVDAMADDPDDIELIGLRKVSLAPVELSVPHNVCCKTLYDIAGYPGEPGANSAIYALVRGEVRLDDIPEALRGAEKRAERIAWLADQVDGPEDEEWCIDTYPGLHPNTAQYSTRHGRGEEADK